MSALEAAARSIEQAESLDALASRIQSLGGGLLEDAPALDAFLGGEWLGHPMHPPASQLPLGAWLMSTVLDVVDGERHQGAVDLLNLLGILTAVPTVASGAHDWLPTTGEARRIGLVHALTMDATLVLFIAALVQRRRGERRRGRRLALLAAATAGAGAYLGGHLVFRLGVGRER